MQPKKIIEDFVCENCGEKVVGDGYTDHCPTCLWGKHVDEETPGDRESGCKGLMRPMYAFMKNNEQKIHYKCQRCNHEFDVRTAKNDGKERIFELCGNV